MTTEKGKLVGPLIRGVDGDIAEAVMNAVEIDNPDAEIIIRDEVGYIRINTVERCVLTQQSLAEEMGRDFKLSQLEPAMSGFAGRMKVTDDEIVCFLERQD